MKLKDLSLLTKAFLAVTIILFPIIISFFHSYVQSETYIKTQNIDDVTMMAEAYEGQVYQFFEMTKRRVEDFSTDLAVTDGLKAILEGRPGAPARLSSHLSQRKLPLDRAILRICVLGPDGKVLASTDPRSVGRDTSAQAFFRKAMEGLSSIEEQISSGRTPEIAAASPIRDPATGRIMGAIANFQQLSDLNKVLTGELNRELGAITWAKGKRSTFESYIVNGRKLMLTDSRFVPNTALVQVVDTPPVRECLERGVEYSGLYKDYRGVEVVGASMCLPSMNWVLLAEVDSEEIFEPLNHLRNDVIVGASAAAGLIGVIFIFFYRHVITRLRAVSAALSSIAKGDYDTIVPVDSDDEIGTLSEGFNRMSSEIKTRTELLKASEGKYRSLVSHIPDITWTADAEGRILFVSPNITDLIGFSQEEILSDAMIWFGNIHSDDLERVQGAYHALLTKKRRFDEEYRLRRKDGSWAWVHDRAVTVYFKEGNALVDGVLSDVTDRKLAEGARQEIQERLENLLDGITVGVFRVSGSGAGELMEANRALAAMLEAASVEELIGKPFSGFFVDPARKAELKGRLEKTGFISNEEAEVLTLKGRRAWLSISAVARQAANGLFFDGIAEDISERKRLEEQLRHSQKLEAVGQLAGGVAHDFNNILTAIIGYGNLLLMKKGEDETVRNYADHMLTLSEKAANLTQSLLAFSRKQIMNPQPVNLNELIRRLEKILGRLIGEDVRLRSRLVESDNTVKADATQIEQVLMNLVTNARDAMPGGGVITISTEVVEIGGDFITAHGYGEPGRYALIEVSDTGSGMDDETIRRIFEPFFTTKEVGKGTGLGLSVVYGIVKQHNGFINVYSNPGIGSTFKIYLPIIEPKEMKSVAESSELVRGGSETILLAEDEDEVRAINRSILEEFGYRVIEAADGEDAVEKFAAHGGEVDLLLLDIIMPRKNGKECLEEIRKTRPGVKAVFTSGYAADLMKTKGIIEPGAHFISKPASPGELLRKVREAIDDAGRG